MQCIKAGDDCNYDDGDDDDCGEIVKPVLLKLLKEDGHLEFKRVKTSDRVGI